MNHYQEVVTNKEEWIAGVANIAETRNFIYQSPIYDIYIKNDVFYVNLGSKIISCNVNYGFPELEGETFSFRAPYIGHICLKKCCRSVV